VPSATQTRTRKLPDDAELRRLREDEGMSVRDIANEFGSSYEAVRLRFKGMGVRATQEPLRYDLPWSIRPDHNNHAILREWKKWKRRELGASKSEAEAEAVDRFVAFMEGNNSFGVPLSIGYDRTEGFYVRRRRVGDHDYLTTA
jgi:hypothetical protein